MIVNLSHRALLCISGEDAEDFLQKQLSNDITSLTELVVQLNAYCTHQGKIVALFYVFKIKANYYLSFPPDLLEKVKKRLAMFVLNARVKISDVSKNFSLLGLIDEKLSSNLGKLITYHKNQQWLLLDKSIPLTKFNLDDIEAWQLINIKKKLPDVYLDTSEKFIPQMLNLDVDEIGVNFQKGCYPGQEIVARLHYLGKAKRRLATFKCDVAIKIGDILSIKASQSLKPSGVVVLVAKVANKFYCLATAEMTLINEDIYVNNNKLERFDV